MSLRSTKRAFQGARTTVDVMCLGQGSVNAANEVAEEPITKFAKVPGKLEALSGRELEQAQQIRASIRWRFTCRQKGIEPDNWLCQKGFSRKLNVEAVLPDERDIDQMVLCSERA